MAGKTIVGAGLSGLTAAINLAKRGHRVTVLERESGIGGKPEFRPDPAGSPLNLEGLKAYAGIDFSPAARPIDEMQLYVYGAKHGSPFTGHGSMYMVERGSRPASIDSLLYREALGAGVEFKFNHPVATLRDFACLEPGTIVATGFDMASCRALGIPFSPLFACFSRGKAPHDRTTVAVWLDSFTRDYAFNCTINGVAFALVFQRGAPLDLVAVERFRKMLARYQGLKFEGLDELLVGACPVRTFSNPRLFHGRLILAGTLAGVIDPFLYFGMLGAIVSGQVAAIAADDRTAGLADFRKAVHTYYRSYCIGAVWRHLPHPARERLLGLFTAIAPRKGPGIAARFSHNLPGWRLQG